MRGPRSALGALLAGAVLASSVAPAEGAIPCDRALQIEGPPDAVAALRAALRESSLSASTDATCADARVSLRERDGGYTVALAVAGDHVERDVASIAAAATWVEGWLTASSPDPPDAAPAAPPPPPVAVPRSATPDRPEPQAPAPMRVIFVEPAALLALVGTGALGTDGSLWGGAEISARLHLTSALWMGAALGVEADTTWTGPAEDADTRRLGLRASARAGARVPLSRRFDAVLGGGIGVTWATAVRQFPTDEDDIQQGGVLLEAYADASLRLSRRLSILGGLGVRGRFLSGRGAEDETEALVPDPIPALTGELRIGAGWELGGSP